MTKPPEPSPLDRAQLDELIDKMNELARRFQEERAGRQPFETHLRCPLCENGTVRGWYKEPLYGGLTCDTPGCLMKWNF